MVDSSQVVVTRLIYDSLDPLMVECDPFAGELYEYNERSALVMVEPAGTEERSNSTNERLMVVLPPLVQAAVRKSTWLAMFRFGLLLSTGASLPVAPEGCVLKHVGVCPPVYV